MGENIIDHSRISSPKYAKKMKKMTVQISSIYY